MCFKPSSGGSSDLIGGHWKGVLRPPTWPKAVRVRLRWARIQKWTAVLDRPAVVGAHRDVLLAVRVDQPQRELIEG